MNGLLFLTSHLCKRFGVGIIIYKFKKKPLIYTFIFICFITSIIFVYHNYGFYERPIAKVIQTDLEDSTDITDIHDNNDRLFTQHIIAEIKNGEEKGQLIHLTNKYSLSGANDQPYQKGNEVFVSFEKIQ